MSPRTTSPGTSRRTAAIGVVAVSLTVVGAGVAAGVALRDRQAAEATAGAAVAAVDEAFPVPAPEDVVPEYLAGAEEYTQERSDAFWGAGYYLEDAFALAELWDVELMEAKGRAGQMLLDGAPLPVAPGSSLDLADPDTVAMLEAQAFGDAGYTTEDAEQLAALWDVDVVEAKAMAGTLLRDGKTLPVPPSSTPPPRTLGR